MKNIISISFFLLLIITFTPLHAQDAKPSETYSKTLNIGIGVGGYAGYYKYANRSLPVLHFDYELAVSPYFTLAPFISVSTFTNQYYWGDANKNYPYRYYNYRETVIPIGVKGTYYFDKLLSANYKWDFYLAASLGYAIINSSWDNDYYGDRNYYNNGSSLFLDVHLGTEYHVNNKVGLFIDLSTGVSTVGIAIH